MLGPPDDDRLKRVLVAEFGDLPAAYVIHSVPEQGEEFYTVVVPPDTVAVLEIPREVSFTPQPIVERYTVDQYRRKRLSKSDRRRLDVAARLARSAAGRP